MSKAMQGTLVKGSLTVEEGELKGKADGEVTFMFNPTEYSISKRNTWNLKANKGRNVPKLEFGGGDPRELTLELFFDSFHPLEQEANADDLRKLTNRLFNFMMVDTGGQMRGARSHMSHPPKCRLHWGKDDKHHFDCYITSCTVKYLMFTPAGAPVRATANLTLKEARDSAERLPTNPTSVGEPGRRLREVQAGDRLDLIAYQEYGAATEWRRIAEANRLTDPTNLRPGMKLVIPPRV